jgi:hypothetical protein
VAGAQEEKVHVLVIEGAVAGRTLDFSFRFRLGGVELLQNSVALLANLVALFFNAVALGSEETCDSR